jgi:hypothetical protein
VATDSELRRQLRKEAPLCALGRKYLSSTTLRGLGEQEKAWR